MWIVGSSLIVRAHKHAKNNTGGADLGLQSFGVAIRWAGKNGMTWEELYKSVHDIFLEEGPPQMLIIHCGANNIGTMSVRKLRNFMKFTISQIVKLMPCTLIVWSEMLPRLSWRYMVSNIAAENARIRINSCIATFVISQKRGGCIRYPDIKQETTKLFSDGVHLSELGNSLFVNTIQGGIYTFISSKACIYP